MELNIRKLKESDWETLVNLWKMWPEWEVHPTKALLPENGTGGFIVEKNKTPIVAGFLYTTNSKVAWFEWVVSNANYRDSDRKEAMELLLNGMESVAKSSGFKIILSIARNKGLINTHKKLGYTVDDKPSYEISKIIN
tara:strand:- start:811 stop:1224 length:414 start_codon:yes stop_codon:yes gene_type:complete